MLGLRPSEEKVGDELDVILDLCSWTGVMTRKGMMEERKEQRAGSNGTDSQMKRKKYH